MQVVCREYPARRKFGVELETDSNLSKADIAEILIAFEEKSKNKRHVVVTPGIKGWSETHSNNYWHVKYDSTCGPLGKHIDHGWEVASYIACGADDLDSISSLGDSLHLNGVNVTKNCGMHVHVDATDFDEFHMGVLLAHWLRLEKYLFAICPSHRHNNRYCKSLWQRMHLRQVQYHANRPDVFWRQIAPVYLHSYENDDKKYALNTVGWTLGRVLGQYDRNTVELRIPECSLQKEHIAGWVAIILNFVDVCASRDPPPSIDQNITISDVLIGLGLQDQTRLLLLEPLLWKAKCWFLGKLAKSSFLSDLERCEALNILNRISDFTH